MSVVQKPTSMPSSSPLAPHSSLLLHLQDITKVYRRRQREVVAFKAESLDIKNGEYVAVVGPSGSGKTTLLSMLGGMLSPDTGKIWFDGESLYDLSITERTQLRRERIGFVFQTFNLVPYLTALENVQVPLFLHGVSKSEQRDRAVALLEQVGLGNRIEHKPSELSTGQQQRVALARTLANNPRLILADEPTGNLDPESREAVLSMFDNFVREGRTIVMVTHDPGAAARASRRLRLSDGKSLKARLPRRRRRNSITRKLSMKTRMSRSWYGAGTLVLAAMMTCPLATDAKEPLVRLSGLKSLVSQRAAGGPKSLKSASTTMARDKEVAVRGQDDEPRRVAPKPVVPPAPPAAANGKDSAYEADVTVPQKSDRVATRMTLAELESLALSNNPTLEQAAAGVEVERGSFQQAGLYPNPQIGYVNGASDKSSVKQSNGAFFSQEIVTAGKLKKAQDWEANEVNKVAWDLEAQRQRVLTDVKIRYFESLGAQHAVLTLKKLERISERGLDTVRQLVENKSAARADLLQAKIQLETVRASLDEATERHSAAWQQLSNVVGIPDLPTALLEGELKDDLPKLDARAAWEQLVAASPQIKSAEAERDHAHAELTLAEAQAIPNITLQAVAEYDRATQSSNVSTLVALPLPIFNRNRGNIAISKATRERLYQEYQARLDASASEASALAADGSLLDELLRNAVASLPELEATALAARSALARGDIDGFTYVGLETTANAKRLEVAQFRQALLEQRIALQTLLAGDPLVERTLDPVASR